jgi:FtsZ-binding cell division protein ZapB
MKVTIALSALEDYKMYIELLKKERNELQEKLEALEKENQRLREKTNLFLGWDKLN